MTSHLRASPPLASEWPAPPGSPRPNAAWQRAPGGIAWLLRRDVRSSQRKIGPYRWGLPAHWTDEPGPREATCLIADDRIAQTPYLRALVARRRGLVLVGAYVEWQVDDFGLKQPYSVSRSDGGMFALAAVWEKLPFMPGETGCFAVLTTSANTALSALHPRMPAVIAEPDWPTWLGETGSNPTHLLLPAETSGWQVQRVPRAEVAVPRGRTSRISPPRRTALRADAKIPSTACP